MGVKFEGVLSHEGKWWAVGVPALDVWTQGKNRADAYVMIKEAVELSMDRPVEVEVLPMEGCRFVLRAKDSRNDRYLMAMMLKNHRAKSGLSLAQVADRLNVTRGTYAQYEQARSLPSVAKVEAYISAMSISEHVVLNIVSNRKIAPMDVVAYGKRRCSREGGHKRGRR